MSGRLELDGVTVATEAGVTLVDGVSFTVEPATTTGLVGESGSGKTLTALAVLGLLPNGLVQRGGEVRLGGERLDRARARAGVAMVPQDTGLALNPVMRIGAQLEETVRAHRDVSRVEAQAQAVALLGRVGLAEPERRAAQLPHQLSGGMRQRVLIAAALASKPQVLIADEPTTALDATVQRQILGLLDDVRAQERVALVVITHDLGVVAQACEQVVVLFGGRVCEIASVRAFFDAPAHPYSQTLLAARPKQP